MNKYNVLLATGRMIFVTKILYPNLAIKMALTAVVYEPVFCIGVL
jgi:hypothetical protein